MGEGLEIMTEAQQRVVDALEEMLDEMPYRKITVHELCLRAKISRNTFYTNFEDKEDVARFVFDVRVVQPIRDLNRLLTIADLEPLMVRMNEQMYERLKANGGFFRKLICPMRGTDDTFLRIATHAIYDLNMEIIPRVSTIGEPWKLDYVSYFFASSQAMLMQKWVCDGMEVTPADLSEFYSSITSAFWHGVSR